ncbi:MAG: DUF6340 family protein [Bacteroidia bacterium]|nr:DUF6340 family protein [Bacteroidia bacterium]MDW8346414.1 DUF6340 family protein [Bacteroidia bacterium]
MKRIFSLASIFSLVLLLCTACTRTIHIQALRPAAVTLPSDIETIIVINRYKPDDRHKFKNFIEGLLTGERIRLDRIAADMAVNSVVKKLSESPRVIVKTVPFELQGTGTWEFPQPLSVDVIKQITQEHKADAIVCLEVMDSNSWIRTHEERRKRTVNGQQQEYVVSVATRWVSIDAGWRVYDGKTGSVLDEHRMHEEMSWSSEAADPKTAVSQLMPMDRAVPDVGAAAGWDYATRIAPSWIWLTREYYSRAKKNPQFRQGVVEAQANHWREAANKWRPLTDNPDKKIAKRACLNMAVACEVEGNLEAALSWAKKGAAMGSAKCSNYIYTLLERIEDEKRLQIQMQKPNKEDKGE